MTNIFCFKRFNLAFVLLINLLLTACFHGTSSISNINSANNGSCYLDAVVLTAGKDSLAFERSIQSSLKHLVDVRNYYIIAPHAADLIKKYQNKTWFSDRIKIVGEDGFPFKYGNISEIMIQSVVDAGVYPITGKSTFEHTVWGRVGWFLQQLLKFYAGKVLSLNDFVLLDSDVIWFKDIPFIAACNATLKSFYYTSRLVL